VITPTEIKKKALRKYADFLRAVITRESFFPLSIKGKKGSANAPLEVLFPSLKLLLEGGKDKLGFGYEVSLKTINTRHAGAISMPDDIYFDNVEDYLSYIEKDKEFVRFQKTVLPTLKKLPALKTYLQKQPLQAIKHLDIWSGLMKVCRYFSENPQADCYIRDLPIDILPTFIKANEVILTELLNVVIPSKNQIKSLVFEERFGLRFDAPTVRIRMLEEGLLRDFPAFVSDVSLPLSQFQQANISAENIFLIEDKDCFLSFPKQTKSIAIYSNPHPIKSLQKLNFLHHKQVFFWGDISAVAFEKLSDLRGTFPQIQSILMNEKTLNDHATVAIQKNVNLSHLAHLSQEENACYLLLQDKKKLEQKEISQEYVIQEMKNL